MSDFICLPELTAGGNRDADIATPIYIYSIGNN